MSLLKKLLPPGANLPQRIEVEPLKKFEDNFQILDAEFQAIVDTPPGQAIVSHAIVTKKRQEIVLPDGAKFEDDTSVTVLHLFTLKPDTEFTFYVRAGKAASYLNAMRQVVSRVRSDAKKEKRPITFWKMLVSDVELSTTYDRITIVRTQSSSLKAKTLASKLIDAMNAEANKEEGE